MLNPLTSIILDDGQVLTGNIGDLNHYELLSLANQLARKKRKKEAQALMEYQYRKFIKSSPQPPQAA